MNHRERQLATIRHQLPDRISVDAIWVENTEAIAAHLDMPHNPEAIYHALDLDGRIIKPPFAGSLPPAVNGELWSEWGVPDVPHYGSERYYPLAAAETVAEVERYPWPDPACYDFSAAARAAHDLAEYAVRGPHWTPLFCRACDMLGMEEAMVKMRTAPAVFEAVLEQITQHLVEHCRLLVAACGDDLPILCLGDDFASQRGLLFSPDLWRKFIKPRYARLFEVGKRAGKLIWLHSCGDISAVLPDLIEIGMDVWETVQLHTLPMPAEQLKREYGQDMTFFGGINTQRLPFARPDEIHAEVRRCIEILGKGGGYICGPDHHIKPDVPAVNALALYEEARSFRREGYTAPSR